MRGAPIANVAESYGAKTDNKDRGTKLGCLGTDVETKRHVGCAILGKTCINASRSLGLGTCTALSATIGIMRVMRSDAVKMCCTEARCREQPFTNVITPC